MAAISSNGTGGGNWSAGASWTGGSAPGDADTATILAGDTITVDVDQSAYVTGVGITVNDGGYLVCSTATGNYYLMCSADLVVAGVDGLQAGTSTSVPLPSDVTFHIDFNTGAFSIEGNDAGSIKLYCGEPTNKWVRLSGAEAAGQTVWSVDTDLTSDTWWADGAEVAIVDSIPATAVEDVERRTIAAGGIAANTITVTAGLTNDKVEGAYVCLLTRNIVIDNSSTWLCEDLADSDIYAFLDGPRGINSCDDGLNIGGAIYNTNGYPVYICRGGTYLDCVIINDGASNDLGVWGCWDVTTSANALVGGFQTALSNDSATIWDGLIIGNQWAGNTITNSAINGTTWGCHSGFQTFSNCYFYGDVTVESVGFQGSSGGSIAANCEIDADHCLDYVGSMQLYNVLFTAGSNEFRNYTQVSREKFSYAESFDHDQTEAAYKAWCRGGVVTSQTASPPTGYTIWYELACEDTTQTYPCFRQYETTVLPGTALEVTGQIRIADGEDLSTSGKEPQLQIIDKFADPLVDSTQSPLDYDIPADVTGVTTDWQTVNVIWANQGDAPRQVIVRMIAYVDAGAGDAVDVDTVWAIANYQDQIQTLYDVLIPVKTTVATADTTTSFTLTAGTATADIYNNMTLMVQDADDDHWELRNISDWTAGRVITVDTAFGFTPAAGDLAYIMATSYGAPVDLTAITDKLPTNYIMGSSDQDNHDTDIDAILVDTGTTLDNHLTDIKGTGFVKDTDSMVDLAHTGADGDTLETLSDQIDAAQTSLDTIEANTGKVLYGTSYTSTGERKITSTGSVTGFIEDPKE